MGDTQVWRAFEATKHEEDTGDNNRGNKFSHFLIIYNLFFESSRIYTSAFLKSITRRNTLKHFLHLQIKR